jgi:hypothetical protein
VAFVYSTREDLQFIFDVAGPYLAPSVADYLWLAWHAVQARGEFERLVDAIEGRDYDDELDRAGLSGPELDFKLSGLEAAREAGRETQAPRWLKRWLKWIDVILGSLLAATGVGESIKEIKEGVEAELEPHDEPRA